MVRNLIAVFLAFVVLVTTSGFTISSHICGGKKVKTVMSITYSDVSCGMEEDSDRISCEKGSIMTSNCCQNEFQLVQFDKDYTQQLNEVEFNHDMAAVLFTVVFELYFSEITQEIFYSDYSPPPLVKNIPVLVQSFLI